MAVGAFVVLGMPQHLFRNNPCAMSRCASYSRAMSTHDDQRTPQPSRSDPERIRALAHPLRLALLDYLDDVGEATATQCAKHTGESVANCSFHLRLLARYGFIEPAEPRGRERPWRPSADRSTFVPDESVPGSVRAVVELAEIDRPPGGRPVRRLPARAGRPCRRARRAARCRRR